MSNTVQKKARQNYRNRPVNKTIAAEPLRKGGILAALRRSPLVGADLNLTRSREANRRARVR